MKTLPLLVALFALGFFGFAVADEPVASELGWMFSEDFFGLAKKANPNVD